MYIPSTDGHLLRVRLLCLPAISAWPLATTPSAPWRHHNQMPLSIFTNSFRVTLLFLPFNLPFFEDWDTLWHLPVIFCAHLRWFLQQFINCGHILCRAKPEHFLHQIKTSPCLSILFIIISCPPRCNFPHLLNLCFESFAAPFWPCTISFDLHVLATSSTVSCTGTCLLWHTTPSDVSFLPFSWPRKSTSLSTWA